MKSKTMAGVFAVLFLVSTVALAEQQYQPQIFPQAANTALAGGSSDESSPASIGDNPSAMASDQAVAQWSSPAASGSPFPSAANPSIGGSSDEQSSPSYEGGLNTGSPFPSAANPSRD